jgi:hypothetical protein
MYICGSVFHSDASNPSGPYMAVLSDGRRGRGRGRGVRGRLHRHEVFDFRPLGGLARPLPTQCVKQDHAVYCRYNGPNRTRSYGLGVEGSETIQIDGPIGDERKTE